jgi:general secretion pathway protein B
MSYILDALKKSEQARQQGAGGPKYSLLPVAEGEAPQRLVWPYVLAAVLLLNVAVLYAWMRPAPPAVKALTVQPVALSPPDAPAAKEAAAATIPAAKEPAVIPAANRVAEPPQAPPARVDRPAATPKPAREAPAKPVVAKVPSSSARIPAPTPDAAVKRQVKPAAEAARATPASEEKPTQKKEADEAASKLELPAISVSGVIHGEGSSGMAIVNDKLVREGDEISPGLKLEKILGDNVIFNYKGQRFTR